jgi:ABC-2 type transport system ATP-binding protein
LSGILHPDDGEATVLGHVPWRSRSALAFDIGTVFGQRSQLSDHSGVRHRLLQPGVLDRTD